MTRKDINKLKKMVEAHPGLEITGTRAYRKGDYSLDVVDTRSGYPFCIHSLEQWDDTLACAEEHLAMDG